MKGAKVTNSNNANNVLPTSPTVSVFTFDTVEFDSNGLFNLATPTRLTAKEAGTYEVGFHTLIQANATGNRLCAIRKNGVTNIAFDRRPNVGAADTVSHLASTKVQLLAGDYIEVTYSHNAGVDLTPIGGGSFPQMWMIKQP